MDHVEEKDEETEDDREDAKEDDEESVKGEEEDLKQVIKVASSGDAIAFLEELAGNLTKEGITTIPLPFMVLSFTTKSCFKTLFMGFIFSPCARSNKLFGYYEICCNCLLCKLSHLKVKHFNTT